ncbi:UNVERIFIED_CONTAM: hypothetical protein NCL1_29067 [Trichonephila clavipes]
MLLTIHFDNPFHGRVYARGNPSQCFVVGTGQTSLQFAISMGARCGTTAETSDQFVNEVVVQQHPVIMTDHDKTIKVVCSFETQERTYTMAGPGVGGGSGVDVARTYNKAALTAVVTNTAPPPNVAMRVLDRTGRDARAVGLGEELTLKIELREASSAFAIFARNLYARSTNGESLFLIDSSGCPTDATIFPALQLDPTDHKSLISTFKAFRFPSSGMVNFEVQIRFCQEKCEQVRCGGKGHSYGRKKRELKNIPFNNRTSFSLLDDEDVYFDHDSYDTIRAVVQEESQSMILPPSENIEQNSMLETESTTFSATVYGTFSDSSDSNSNQEERTKSPTLENDPKINTTPEMHKTSAFPTGSDKNNVHESLLTTFYEKEIKHNTPQMTSHDIFTTKPDTSTTRSFYGKSSTARMGISRNTASTTAAPFTTEMLQKDIPNTKESENSITTSTTFKTGNKQKTEDPHRSSVFNRKFAFIHNEENNGTNLYTTPIPAIQFQTINYMAAINNQTDRRVNLDTRINFDMPDKNLDHSQTPKPLQQNQDRPFHRNDPWPSISRTDPFSAVRNPYSQPNNRRSELDRNSGQDSLRSSNKDRVHQLPSNPQRLVDNVNPPRTVNSHSLLGTDSVGGQSHAYPPLKSHPIEIHEIPGPWDASKNRDSYRPQNPVVPPYNIYNPHDLDNRQPRVVTTSPNFPNRPREINTNTNPWVVQVQQSPGIQIQRPLEILDHPNQRHDRHPNYPHGRPTSNQPRPVEISNPNDRNSYQPNRYDHNRPISQPIPAEMPNQHNPQPWNNNNNRVNNVPTVPPVNHDMNIWGNNSPTNTRAPPRGINRPEEPQVHRPQQPYPQQSPPGQNSQRNDDTWRNNPPRQSNSNSVPGRNNFYASQPQFRPSEVIATTQKSIPEEVPLSLAILVGEDGKSQNSANQKPKQQWRPATQYNRGLQRHNIINKSPTCQYREFPDRFLPQLDRLSRAYNLKDCQRQCDTERDFVCRSVNFETVAKDCALSSEDISSVPQGVSALQPRRNSLYSEKGSCEQG